MAESQREHNAVQQEDAARESQRQLAELARRKRLAALRFNAAQKQRATAAATASPEGRRALETEALACLQNYLSAPTSAAPSPGALQPAGGASSSAGPSNVPLVLATPVHLAHARAAQHTQADWGDEHEEGKVLTSLDPDHEIARKRVGHSLSRNIALSVPGHKPEWRAGYFSTNSNISEQP